jgi:DNA-binding NarL/FixJ family response regulator
MFTDEAINQAFMDRDKLFNILRDNVTKLTDKVFTLEQTVNGFKKGLCDDLGLSRTEFEVLRMLRLGYKNVEIAEKLSMSEQWVCTIRKRLKERRFF